MVIWYWAYSGLIRDGSYGLDHYELTKHRGWYHHITLSMMAMTFLKTVQWELKKKKF
jgi:SRSO17 transposase